MRPSSNQSALRAPSRRRDVDFFIEIKIFWLNGKAPLTILAGFSFHLVIIIQFLLYLRPMCGIIGYIGKREAEPILLKGLERLEYRGYDSAGIALMPAPPDRGAGGAAKT